MRTKDFMPKIKKHDLGNAILIFLLKIDQTLNKIQCRRIFINMYHKLQQPTGDNYFNEIKKHVEYETKKDSEKS